MNHTTLKCMYGPIGCLHTGRNHPSSWTNALKNSHPHWINYSKKNWKAKPTPISDTRFKTITTTTGLPHLPLRQKPWSGDHRTSQLHQDRNEGSPAGWTYLPTAHQC